MKKLIRFILSHPLVSFLVLVFVGLVGSAFLVILLLHDTTLLRNFGNMLSGIGSISLVLIALVGIPGS